MCLHCHDQTDRFPAHISDNGRIQTVPEHCRETAQIASYLLQPLALCGLGYLAGLLHDSGKMTAAFRYYLISAIAGKPVKRGSVPHTFTGLQYILKTFHNHRSSYESVTAELLACAIGAHHGQFDLVDEEGSSSFESRLNREDIHYNEAIEHFLKECSDKQEIKKRFEIAAREVEFCIDKITALPDPHNPGKANQEIMFYMGQLARLLLSAVIEGDRRSTAAFIDPKLTVQPLDLEGRRIIWQMALDNLEGYIAQLPADSQINQARKAISEQCANFADHPSGIYRLNIPTGGGKTLSGLRFGLAHALKWNKAHVFYIAPLISILEQNADVIRKAVGCADWVLEHHSNIVRDNPDEDELRRVELLQESWSAPVIVTTFVQFLNTLFSGEASSVRRYQALTNSVIIIDEVQTVPAHMLSLFNLAMNFLSGVCSSTIILCSATQPCFEEISHSMRISDETPVPYNEEQWRPFARTKIMDAGAMRLDEVPGFIEHAMAQVQSVLLICNKKGEAEELYHKLKRDDWHCFHLSASMCVAHRRFVLEALNSALDEARKSNRKALCVSTQLIEAGVDISFDCVIRLCAGMDSVIQAAGRCNRNGEAGRLAPVWIVRCENEKLTGLKDIQRGKKTTSSLLYAFGQEPERFMDDLASDKAIQFYYRALFNDIRSDGENQMDYPVAAEHMTLFELLSDNAKFVSKGLPATNRFFLRQAFKTAGRLFKVFDDDTQDVIVPFGEGKELIQQLMSLDDRWQLGQMADLLKLAKPYTVSVYAHQVERLLRQGALMQLCGDAVLALMDGYYNDETGLITDRMMNCFLEV